MAAPPLRVGADPPKPKRRRNLSQIIEDLQRVIADRGGICHTVDIRSRESVLDLECSEGHTWRARVGSILSGHWCHACGRLSMETAYKKRIGILDLDDVDEVALWAESRGFEYVQNGKLRVGRTDFFSCSDRHLWEVSRDFSRLGSWCPICGTRGESMGVGRQMQ